MKRWPDGSPRLSPSQCPHCGYWLNAASQLGNDRPPPPDPGDLTVCFGCGGALQFDCRLRLVKLSATQQAALDPAEAADLRLVQTMVRAFLAREAG